MNNIKLFENYKNIEIVFTPSGEVINITKYEFNTISELVILEYNVDLNAYIIEDSFRDVIIAAIETIQSTIKNNKK